MAIWDDVISQRDKEVYAKAGMGRRRVGFGKKPAIIIVDINYNWVGGKPEPILKSLEKYPFSCGEEGWQAVYQLAQLLPLAREKGVPIVYSTGERRSSLPRHGRGVTKSSRQQELYTATRGNEIVEEIAPQEGDLVIYKTKPSIFFGTPLVSLLNALEVDTLLVCGGTTSGCVRASVVDGYSYNFKVAIIQECTFDRGEVSHKVNLFDMNAKYGDVVSATEVREYLQKL